MENHIQVMTDHWSKLLTICILVLSTQVHSSDFADITFVDSAVSKGAVCLDGSRPAYFHAKGFGEGANNWLVYLEGGAWCNSTADCRSRSKSFLGSSTIRVAPPFNNTLYLQGLMIDNKTFNPDFYNWNRVQVIYCDGSSFMGDVEEVDPKTNVTLRGARVFKAVMEDLMAKGMKNAKNAILAGGSAGGLATIHHCDGFRAFVPNANRVKCISDSGFFIHAKHLQGAKQREEFFTKIVEHHRIDKFLPPSCTSKMSPGLCIFPEYVVGDIKTPIFLLESAFDAWQITSTYLPFLGDDGLDWTSCVTNVTRCTSDQLQILKEFRSAFIATLQNLKPSSSRGMFVHSCFLHTHILIKSQWTCSSVVGNVLSHKTIGKAIGDWYFDRSSFQHIDTKNDVPRNCTNTLNHANLNKKCLRAQLH